MSVEANIALMRRWFDEIWNRGRWETVDEIMAPDGVGRGTNGPEGEVRGRKQFIDFARGIRAAFPDLQVKVEDMFGSADKVAVRWTAEMTHMGDHLGVPASGHRVRLRGVSIARIEGGQLVECWDNWDQLSMVQAIGAIPANLVVFGTAA